MKKPSLHIFIGVLCGISFAARAQYLGGSVGGFASQSFISSMCPAPLNSSIYFGGSADGFAYNPFIASICSPPLNSSIYFGGSADGFAYNPFIASICSPPLNSSIYFGGSADGFAYNPFIASICSPPLNSSIYFGGSADGFSLGKLSICIPLPIELLEFKASLGKEGVELSWTTVSEIKNDFFTVERSTTGIKFTTLATVKGAGNSIQKLNYYATDGFPADGPNYYRLKQTDFDGKFSFSDVIVVYFGQSLSSAITIYPNPNDGKSFYVKLAGSGQRLIALEIHDVAGRKILSESMYFESNIFEFVPSVALTPGMYLISIIEDQKISKQKLVVK
jgi:hypothetical protein